MQTDVIRHNLIFTGGGSRLNDLDNIANTRLSSSIINTNSDKFETPNQINREFLACYGAMIILTKGVVSEAIAIPNKGPKDKNAFFTRIFDIFS